MSAIIHDLALCETDQIGVGTRVWAFSHILPGAQIGNNCNICENVFIENRVRIGNNVTIKNGVQVWDGIILEDDVFIGPNVTFTNDKYPVSGNSNFKMLATIVERGASIGANSTILPGITIGTCSVIGAGSVVTKNIPAHAVAFGNPAQIRN